jgi:hypothetical protein
LGLGCFFFLGGGLGLRFGVVVVLVVVERDVVVGVVLVDGTDWVDVVGVVSPGVEVVVIAHATPAPKKSAHAAIATARASVRAS